MDVLILCIAAAVIAALIGLVIKKSNPEAALVLALGAAVFVLMKVFAAAGEFFGFLERLAEMTSVSGGVVAIMLKTVGVALITGFASDVCKDAGQSALASACETAGSVTALYIALPLMETVLETMEKLL